MSFLLDTNVVSELAKPRPDSGVIRWLAEADEDRVFLSVVALAELRHGVQRVKDDVRRKRLDQWIRRDLALRFEHRILPIGGEIADEWGKMMARGEAAGRPIGPMDAFVAATAAVHHLTLVTRNTSDFRPWVEAILNPWVRA